MRLDSGSGLPSLPRFKSEPTAYHGALSKIFNLAGSGFLICEIGVIKIKCTS